MADRVLSVLPDGGNRISRRDVITRRPLHLAFNGKVFDNHLPVFSQSVAPAHGLQNNPVIGDSGNVASAGRLDSMSEIDFDTARSQFTKRRTPSKIISLFVCLWYALFRGRL